MQLEASRRFEHEKYVTCYQDRNYRMGMRRKQAAISDLSKLPRRGSYLDVSTGRGEMLREAYALGFTPTHGTEIVPVLIDNTNVFHAEAHDLPFADDAFDVVTMLDVIEHLIPGDDELAVREILRVAKHHILVAACAGPSKHGRGVELHINQRSYDEWDQLFGHWFAPHKVTWLKGGNRISETWRVDL